MSTYSRRHFLRSAGGIPFLALTPIGRGLFAVAANALKPIATPLFTALPYIQSGPEGKLMPGAEIVRLAWQTEQRVADFDVRFSRDDNYGQIATIARMERTYKGELGGRYNYVCQFKGLELGSEYRYRVKCNGAVIAEGYFTTRQPRGRRVRLVAFGDNPHGDISDRAIAYQAYRANPDFIMNTGDNVYEAGLDDEYSRYFFPIYNADIAGPRIGAPLLRSVPFYTVLANHDVEARDPQTKHSCADFDLNSDALAYYSNFHFPLNGPSSITYPTVIRGSAGPVENFKTCAGDRYPRMANYSYDCGDAHFLCLDSNTYTDPTDADLQRWVDEDLASTDAIWKFAVFHHPCFNVGDHHAHEQHMRVLAPIFEKHGVNFVLSGHEHNYQRTVPIRFKPSDVVKDDNLHSKDRLVPGDFPLDTRFDVAKETTADGVIYITTGAGGKALYDPSFNNNPEKWTLPEDNHLRYVAQMVTDRHSITVFDIDGRTALMRQIDESGNEIDRIQVTV